MIFAFFAEIKKFFENPRLSASKREKPLSKIVEYHKQAHAHQHRDVSLELLRQETVCQYRFHRTLGNTIGQHHAHGNINDKADDHSPALFLIFKCIVFVEEKTHHAAYGIIADGRQSIADLSPLMQSRQIIQAEHHRRTHKGVDDAYNKKANKTAVKKISFHPLPFRRRPGK